VVADIGMDGIKATGRGAKKLWDAVNPFLFTEMDSVTLRRVLRELKRERASRLRLLRGQLLEIKSSHSAYRAQQKATASAKALARSAFPVHVRNV